MPRFLIMAGILVFIIAVYLGSYVLNAKTEKPEGAPDISCESCNSKTCVVKTKDLKKSIELCELEDDE